MREFACFVLRASHPYQVDWKLYLNEKIVRTNMYLRFFDESHLNVQKNAYASVYITKMCMRFSFGFIQRLVKSRMYQE